MDRETVFALMGPPDYTSSLKGQPIFFYCDDSVTDPSKPSCSAILLEEDKVAAVGAEASQKWSLNAVRFTAGERREKAAVKKVPAAKPLDEVVPLETVSDNIAVETINAGNAYTPNPGDAVYVTYHTNFVRYIPLRSEPSENGKILEILCIGATLSVQSVEDRWLFVKGIEKDYSGWVPENWVTDDRSVKIDADRQRAANAPEIARLEATVKPIPRSQWQENLRLYKRLSELDPCSLLYQRKVDFYKNYGRRAKKRKRR